MALISRYRFEDPAQIGKDEQGANHLTKHGATRAPLPSLSDGTNLWPIGPTLAPQTGWTIIAMGRYATDVASQAARDAWRLANMSAFQRSVTQEGWDPLPDVTGYYTRGYWSDLYGVPNTRRFWPICSFLPQPNPEVMPGTIIEGTYAAYFPYNTGGSTLWIADAGVSSDFPLKYGTANNTVILDFYFRPEPIYGDECVIVSKGAGNTTSYPDANDRSAFELAYNGGSFKLAFTIYRFVDLGGSYDKTSSVVWYDQVLPPLKWHHIIITFNATTKTVTFSAYNETDAIQYDPYEYTYTFGEAFRNTNGVFAIGGVMNYDGSWAYNGLGYEDPARLDDFQILVPDVSEGFFPRIGNLFLRKASF